MAIETHVIFRGKLPSKAALQRAMKELGFPLSIKPASGSLEQQSGFMPMLLRREETGVEFDLFDRADMAEFEGVDPSFDRVVSFRWASDIREAVAGLCAAAALAKLMHGVVFDEGEDKLLSVGEAIAVASRTLGALPEPSKVRRPRGPTVVRRLVQKLLEIRSDLALVDQLLVIRPVRHLVRGALLRCTTERSEPVLRVYLYIKPLYQPEYLDLAILQNQPVLRSQIEAPDFEPILFDRLAEDVFAHVGKIATSEDFLGRVKAKPHWPETLFESILLSGGVAPARDYLAQFENDAVVPYWVNERRQLLETQGSGIFAHYRAEEANTAKKLKIAHIWEPSPFPSELRKDDRETTSGDPVFVSTPWLEYPTGWRQDAPDAPGEVRFGLSLWRRDDRVMLLNPLTREQAEARHRDYQEYMLAARLAEGPLLTMGRFTSGDIESDGSLREGRPPPLTTHNLWIYGSLGQRIIASFSEDYDDPGILKLRSVNILGIEEEHLWYSFLNFEDNEKSVYDRETPRQSREMTVADRAAYAFPLPRFGELAILWERLSMYLEKEGFGGFT